MPDYSQMTTTQAKAAASDKDASGFCSEIPTPWGIIKQRSIHVDKNVLQQGSVSVSGSECTIQMQNSPVFPPVTNVGPNDVPQPR